MTKHIINGRKDLINSLKKIDSSFVGNGLNYSLLSISKKEYYESIAQSLNNYNVENLNDGW